VVLAADPALQAFVQALLADEVKVAGGKAFIVRDGKATDAATGAAATLPADAEDVVNNNRVRRELEAALAALKLFSPDRGRAPTQAMADLKDQADEGKLPLLEKAIAAETDAELKARLELLNARGDPDLVEPTRPSAWPPRNCWPAANSPPRALLLTERPGRRDRPRGQGRHRRFAGQGRFAPGLGRAPGRAVHRASAWAASCCWWRWAWPSPTA
jgi:hypothetical protein